MQYSNTKTAHPLHLTQRLPFDFSYVKRLCGLQPLTVIPGIIRFSLPERLQAHPKLDARGMRVKEEPEYVLRNASVKLVQSQRTERQPPCPKIPSQAFQSCRWRLATWHKGPSLFPTLAKIQHGSHTSKKKLLFWHSQFGHQIENFH